MGNSYKFTWAQIGIEAKTRVNINLNKDANVSYGKVVGDSDHSDLSGKHVRFVSSIP